MFSFKELIEQKKLDSKLDFKFNSQRSELFSELYKYYERDYKIQAWKSYISWLKQNNLKHNLITLQEYKKILYPKITIKSFCSYWLGFIPTNDLYYLISIAKDMENRKQSFNKWLFWAIKSK